MVGRLAKRFRPSLVAVQVFADHRLRNKFLSFPFQVFADDRLWNKCIFEGIMSDVIWVAKISPAGLLVTGIYDFLDNDDDIRIRGV